MQESTTGRSAPLAAILAIAGGALLALGSFLAWAEVSGSGTSVTAFGSFSAFATCHSAWPRSSMMCLLPAEKPQGAPTWF